ncbi:MAG: extracellular solute-binding protein [Oscillospiraceae bacterium]
MKKLLCIFLSTCMLCGMLTGCGDEKPIDVKKTTYTTQGKETKLVGDENTTGELSVSYYGDAMDYPKDCLTVAVEKFKELYPNVQLNVEQVPSSENWEEYSNKLATEVMSGKGPDLFWTQAYMDIPKMMNAGVFADMHKYFEADKNFNISDYNEAVFTDEQPQGKQYVVPLKYQIPLFMTTQTIIDKIGFDVKKCKDYESCAAEMARVLDDNKNNVYSSQIVSDFSLPMWFPAYSGLDTWNYSNKTATVNTPQIKKIVEQIKSDFYPLKSNGSSQYGGLWGAKGLKEEKSLFIDFSLYSYEFEAISSYQLINIDEEAVAFPWRNVNGKLDAFVQDSVAVRNTSKNKDNAYLFMKILLSPEIQKAGYALFSIPVSNVCVSQQLSDRMNSQKRNEEASIHHGVPKLEKLTQDFIKQYMGYLDEIDNVFYANKGSNIFREEMTPYFEDKKSYEECIENAQDQLEIYISE